MWSAWSVAVVAVIVVVAVVVFFMERSREISRRFEGFFFIIPKTQLVSF